MAHSGAVPGDGMFRLDASVFFGRVLTAVERKGLSPETLVQFAAVLPFRVPVSEETLTFFNGPGGPAVTLMFTAADPYPDNRSSRVEMLYLSDQFPPVDLSVSDIFDLCLQPLNAFLSAYQVQARDPEVYRLKRESLGPTLPYRVITTWPRWKVQDQGTLVLSRETPRRARTLTATDWAAVRTEAFQLLNHAHPYLTAEELSLGASRQLQRGLYKEAVMLAAAAVESFVQTLYRHLLAVEGKDDDEANRLLENTSLLAQMQNQLSSRLGGSWDIKADGPVGEWYEHTYRLRNQVANAALEPEPAAATRAVQAAEALREYVVELIRERAKRYPDVAGYFA